jgi:hypothetical protein
MPIDGGVLSGPTFGAVLSFTYFVSEFVACHCMGKAVFLQVALHSTKIKRPAK